MLEHMEKARAKFNEFMDSEMITLMKAHADLLAECETLRSAVRMSDHFSDKQTYPDRYRGSVSIVFHASQNTRNQWYVVSRSPVPSNDITIEYPTALAAVEAIDNAKSDPGHELVKEHLS